MKKLNLFLEKVTKWGLIILIPLVWTNLFIAGCQESQKIPEQSVWGNGNPDPNHIKFFGNDNLSRLCYVQTQRINQQAQIINQLVALNSKQHKILGESDIELFNRVRKLEDPNEADK